MDTDERTPDETHLTCQDMVELVTDYLEEALPAAARRRFEAHLNACEGCRNYLEQMRQTIVLVGKLNEDSIAPAAMDRLLDAFRHWKRGED